MYEKLTANTKLNDKSESFLSKIRNPLRSKMFNFAILINTVWEVLARTSKQENK